MTINQPSARRGFWFRYTRFRPRRGVDAEPHSALWALAFHRDEPGLNSAAKEVFPASALRVERPFAVRLPAGELGLDGCRGQAGDTSWDLRWERGGLGVSFPFLSPRWQSLATVRNNGAQPWLSVSGVVRVGEREYRLDGEPGGQQHTWGSSHALTWNWGYASGPWGWVDGATSRVSSRLGVLAGTALGARVEGVDFALNSPLAVLRRPGTVSAEAWETELAAGGRRLRLTIMPRPEDLIGVTYDDPAGGLRYCYHTEVADLDLTLAGHTVRRPAAAAFEFAAVEPLPGLPPRL